MLNFTSIERRDNYLMRLVKLLLSNYNARNNVCIELLVV
jgi:hypothetical protein